MIRHPELFSKPRMPSMTSHSKTQPTAPRLLSKREVLDITGVSYPTATVNVLISLAARSARKLAPKLSLSKVGLSRRETAPKPNASGRKPGHTLLTAIGLIAPLSYF
jgi:hypothetical protein